MHTAAKGETLWDIAQRYRVSMQDIIRINGLSPPYALKPEQRIKLPAPREYTVRPGDTLSSIARMFDVSTTETVRLNSIVPPYKVTERQVLRLPPPQEPRRQPLPLVAGTAFSRAQAGMPTERIEDSVPPAQLSVSSMPLEDAPPPLMPAATPDAVEAETLAAPAPVQGQSLPPPVSSFPPQPRSAAPPVSPPAPAMPADVPPLAAKGFAWPVQGSIVSGYGPKQGGLHNDGINIKASKGTPVRAAQNGVVVYAGNQLKGFGNLVLVRHADRWMTAYAHLDSIAARRGQTVRQGDFLGTVGATGSVDSPQLHFEIRRGTAAINPAYYLKTH